MATNAELRTTRATLGGIDDGQGDDDVGVAGTQSGHQSDGQQDAGDGGQAFADAHEHSIGQFKIAGVNTDRRSEEAGHQRHAAAHGQKRPGSVKHTGKEVTAKFVGTEDMLSRGGASGG